MNQERERPRGSEEIKPNFIKIVDKTGRVGILEDDTWMVGWGKPDGQTVWHHHSDVWRVLRQNERVIQKFLGIPINIEEGQEAQKDPSLGASLPDLSSALLIFGEIQKAQQLTTDIITLMTLSINQRTPVTQLSDELKRLSSKLSNKVVNEFKVMAKGKLIEAGNVGTVARAQLLALEATEALMHRTREGASIVNSLLQRASGVLAWVDEQELQIRRLRNAVGAVLIEIKTAQDRGGTIAPQTRKIWKSHFFGSVNELEPTLSIRGNPYSEIVNRPEIKRLRLLKEAIENDDIEKVDGRFSQAYPILDRVLKDREDREASGKYERYRVPSQSSR